MTGSMRDASDTRMKRHDDLVTGIPDHLIALRDKLEQMTNAFSQIHYHTERTSSLAFENAAPGVQGAHAGKIEANNLSAHLAAILKHAEQLATSTRGARHAMTLAEVTTQHENIREIRSQIDKVRELSAGLHGDLDSLHTKLVLLEEMYRTD
jgi:hypothetical protein